MGTLVFVIGLVFGSFFNVCIYRIPAGISIILPPSHCPFCGKRLTPRELIPIISFLLQKGRCRGCNGTISIRYPLIELLTGIIFLIIYLHWGISLKTAEGLVFTSLLIMIFFIDLDVQIIPNILVGIGLAMGLVFRLFEGDLGNGLIGVCLGAGIIFIIYILSRGGMGEGDIKMAGMLGSFLGFPHILLGLFLAFILGGSVGIFLLFAKHKDGKDRMAFGPFLAVAGMTAWMWGDQVITAYLNLILR